MMTLRWLYFFLIWATVLVYKNTVAQKVTLNGYIYEKGSGERIPSAVVSVAGSVSGTMTNAYGFYSLHIPKGDSVRIRYAVLGYSRGNVYKQFPPK